MKKNWEKNRITIWIILLMNLLTLSFCNYKNNPPRKKAAIPDTAVWIGGADGGEWISCEKKEEKFKCKIFDDYFGDLICEGEFSLCEKNKLKNDKWIRTKLIGSNFTLNMSDIIGYDDLIIELKNDFYLVPDGMLIFKFDKKHGLKKTFSMGKEQRGH